MSTTAKGHPQPKSDKKTIQLEGATVRLAGDSGDGMQLTGTRVMQESKESGAPGAATSIFKLVGAALQRDGADLKRDLMGFRGLGAHEEVGFTAEELKATEEFLHLRTTTIYGGSSEIQANIIAKRVLGLPD